MSEFKEKTAWFNEIAKLQHISQQIEAKKIEEKLQELANDIEKDEYMFVVVGEFSTGKSTFLNALIEQRLLPVGITPTTSTINVIRYGENPSIIIYKTDGSKESSKDADILHQFIAKEIEQAEDIDFIEIKQNIPFLKDNILLVDTPGLNDINEMRSIITYDYIPRADVVFFLLDCRTPLRKSEYSFLTDTLLKQSLDRIIFIANFADMVDKDEVDSIVERIKLEIQKGTELKEVVVIPFSAEEALEAIAEEDEELYDISGMNDVKQLIEQLCQSGSRQKEKAYRYGVRLQFFKNELIEALEEAKRLSVLSAEELREQLQKLQTLKEENKQFLIKLKEYTEERIKEFQLMSSTSINTFFNNLEDELIDRIQTYQGYQFDTYFGQEIPNYVKRKMKTWIEHYTPHIHELLSKLEIALSEILSETFNEKISIHTTRNHSTISPEDDVQLIVEKGKDPLLTSGLIVGGASTLFLAIGGSIFIPILGMVGLPYLQRKLQQEQLETIKPQVIGDLTVELNKVRYQFEDEVHAYIRENAMKIFNNSVLYYNDRISQQEKTIEKELNNIQEKQSSQEKRNSLYQQFALELKQPLAITFDK